jgi:hypothetical protein
MEGEIAPFVFRKLSFICVIFASLFMTVGPSIGGVSGQLDQDSGHPGRETVPVAILRILT